MSNQSLKKEKKENLPKYDYEEVSELINNLELSDKLIIISNLLFDCYNQTRKADILYKKLDMPILENIEDYAYMKELYNFHEDSYTFVVLDRAHDLLRTGLDIDKIKFGKP